ncbi:MAG: putative NBD/HSP70 family sugar kinase [Arenicella sp.]|jgi:predicted NBD/HSP70 family sugar kinase
MMDNENKEKLLRANPQKGSNLVAVRGYNEKLVLQLVREHGALTKAEATRATGLSANAISVIFRSLEKEELFIRCESIRGRIGQPSTPIRINPEAHHYVSLKIGRRSLELAVVNFAGTIVSLRRSLHSFPTPNSTLDFFRSALKDVLRSAKKNRKEISGMGVAMPFELWGWAEELGAEKAEMDAWRNFDIKKELRKTVPWDILVENDGTSACRAEQVLGNHTEIQDWIYFFVGTFIGGGVVLNGSTYPGRRGNAGGFGPMRVPEDTGGNRLVDHASLIVLERSIVVGGGQPFEIYDEDFNWDQIEPLVGEWISRAGRNLAYATVSSLSVLDFDAVVIGGALPDEINERLAKEVRFQLENIDLQGVFKPEVVAGKIGRRARVIGAAAAFISADYMVDQNTLNRK